MFGLIFGAFVYFVATAIAYAIRGGMARDANRRFPTRFDRWTAVLWPITIFWGLLVVVLSIGNDVVSFVKGMFIEETEG